MNLKHLTLILVVGTTLQLAGCVAVVAGGAAAGGYYVGKDERTAGEIAADAAITAKVKTRLIEAKGIKSLDINVDTYFKVVTLNGKVRSSAEEAKAVSLARGVSGVKKVINKLEIVRVPVEDQSA